MYSISSAVTIAACWDVTPNTAVDMYLISLYLLFLTMALTFIVILLYYYFLSFLCLHLFLVSLIYLFSFLLHIVILLL